jgi:hypothetical protein
MTGQPRFATYFHVHLVSDSTGETLNAMAKAVAARFEDVLPIEHMYALVRSPRQLERVLKEIEAAPGLVLHTIVDKDLRAGLEEGCRAAEQPCVAALDSLVAVFARYLGASITTRVGAQHNLMLTTSAASKRSTTPSPTTTPRAPTNWRRPTSSSSASAARPRPQPASTSPIAG